jgi:hypothetical protein
VVCGHRCRTCGDFENVSTLVELCAKRTEDETSPSANIRCPSSTIGHMLVNLKKSSGNICETHQMKGKRGGGGGRNKDLHDESYHLTSSMARLNLE